MLREMWSSLLESRHDVTRAQVSARQFVEQQVGAEQARALIEMVTECVERRASFEEMLAKCVGVSRDSPSFLPLLLLQASLR